MLPHLISLKCAFEVLPEVHKHLFLRAGLLRLVCQLVNIEGAFEKSHFVLEQGDFPFEVWELIVIVFLSLSFRLFNSFLLFLCGIQLKLLFVVGCCQRSPLRV